jgi:hypothetical protein
LNKEERDTITEQKTPRTDARWRDLDSIQQRPKSVTMPTRLLIRHPAALQSPRCGDFWNRHLLQFCGLMLRDFRAGRRAYNVVVMEFLMKHRAERS